MSSLLVRRGKHRGRLLVHRLVGDVAIDPLFVVSAPRSGSGLLIDLLNGHPDIALLGEVLNPSTVVGLRAGARRPAVERHLRRSVAGRSPVRGAKLLLQQLSRRGIDVEDLRRLFPDVRLIVLYRADLAQAYVSNAVAGRSGQWHLRGVAAGMTSPQVEVDADAFLASVAKTRERYSALLAPAWVASRSTLVRYEDLTADRARCLGTNVFPFLDLPPSPVTTRLVKGGRPLDEVVSNWSEVSSVLRSSAAWLELR